MGVRGGEHGDEISERRMDEGIDILVEINQRSWNLLRGSLLDISDDEADWRPHPLGNNINAIVRHLRIESEWHRDSLISGRVMPSDVTPELQRRIEAVPLDFGHNLTELETLMTEFIGGLRASRLSAVAAQTAAVYGPSFTSAQSSKHFLGYHQA